VDKALVILAAEFRQFLNGSVGTGARRGKIRKLLKSWGGYVMLLAIAVFIGRGVYKFAAGMNAALVDYPDIARLIWVNLLSAASLAVFVMLFMTGVSVVYQSLYEAGDVKFLLGTPAPVGAVVGAKLVMSLVTNLLTILPFLYPVWIGFGAASHAPVSFYFLVLLSQLLAAAMFTSFVALVVMVIMRYIPSPKMRQVILVGSLVIGFAVFAASQAFSAAMSRRNGLSFEDIARVAQGVNLGRAAWLPHVWMLKTALLTMPGYGYSVWTSLVPLAAAAALIGWAAIALSARAFVGGWTHARETAPSARGRASSARHADRTFINRLQGSGWAIFARDLTMLFRQPVMWYGVLVSIVASAFFVFNISGGGGAAVRASMIGDMIVVIFTMMAAVSTGQFAGLAISLDGEGLWLMKSAPIPPSTYYSAKLAFATAPGAVVLVLLFTGLSFVASVPQHPLYVSVPVGLAVLSVICALSVMSDAIKPNFNVRLSATGNKKQRDPGKALLITFGSQIGSVALGAVFAFPTYYSRIPWFSGWTDATARAVSLGLLAVLVIVGHVVAARVSIRRIRLLFSGGLD
jgi:hypothetical protein